MGRANLIGKGSKETPEPEEVEGNSGNPLGMNDHNALDSPNKISIDGEGNTKKRKVSKTVGSKVAPE